MLLLMSRASLLPADREPRRRSVPRYFLYGEMSGRAAPGFVHIETLSFRSARHGWEINPHRHEGLHQVFWVREGGGAVSLDQSRRRFAGPALIIVPSPLVHAFAWDPGSEGHVLTLASSYISGLGGEAEPEIARALDASRVIVLDKTDVAVDGLDALFAHLAHELTFAAVGMAVAVAARVQLLMVAIARLAPRERATPTAGADVWQAFRAAVELRFRELHDVGDIASDLAVTRSRLNAICRRHAGRTAQQVIHDRIALEAQRSLIFTGLTVAEIGYDLGFRDPAYFTRFFTRVAGDPPGVFRRKQRAINAEGAAVSRDAS